MKRRAFERAWGLALAACIALFSEDGNGATVALVRPSSRAPALMEALFRLQGELLAVGLDVELAERPGSRSSGETDRRALLERMAIERGLDAIIEVVGTGDVASVDIWIFQRSPRRSEFYRVEPEPDEPNAAEALAIRAIEVLRSSFLDLHLPPAPRKAGKIPPSPPKAEEPPVSEPVEPVEHVGLELGAGMLTSLDGVGPAILPVVRFDWAPHPLLLTQVTLSGFGTRPTIETEAGSTTVAQQYGLLGLCYSAPSATGLHPFVAFAAGALRTSFDARAIPPNVAHQITRWSLLLDGSVGARLRLSRRYYLTLAGHMQLAEPYVSVYFVSTRVATTERPNLLVSLTVGAWL